MIQATFEHIALNVADKAAVVDWYTANLGLIVVRDVPGNMAFLADSNGVVVLEIYSNQAADRTDFTELGPLAFHLAFEVADPAAAARELEAAGARIEEPFKYAGDDSMVMLRDPFGLPLQLVHRGKPMRGDA
jgi:catechol 2,3-dioxygenase-like lactoylglutathione lyase family enzyme